VGTWSPPCLSKRSVLGSSAILPEAACNELCRASRRPRQSLSDIAEVPGLEGEGHKPSYGSVIPTFNGAADRNRLSYGDAIAPPVPSLPSLRVSSLDLGRLW
jgi:hypothetical protein